MVEIATQTAEGQAAVAEAQAVIAAKEAEGTAAQPGEPDAKKPAAPAVDYEAKSKAQELDIARLTKLVEDSRGREIGQLRQKEIGDLIRKIDANQELLAEAFVTQDVEGFKAKKKALDDQTKQAQLTADVEKVAVEALAEMKELETGLIALGANKDSAHYKSSFEAVGLYWKQFLETGDKFYSERATKEAHRAARKMEKELEAPATAKAIKEATDKAVKKTKEELGAFDVGAGGESGGGNMEGKALEAAVAEGKILLTPAISAKLHSYWNK